LVTVVVEGTSDAVGPSSPLTCGTTTSDDDEDPAGPPLAALEALDALATVVDVEVLVRCNAARTEDGDSGAGRWSVTEFDTDRIPCSPRTSASNVASAQPPTRSPLRRIPSSIVDHCPSQNKRALNHG